MKLLLDTHALIWWQAKSKKLSRRVQTSIKRAEAVLVSAISCWEVATLVAQGRLKLDRSLDEWLADMEADSTIRVLPLSPQAAILSWELDRAGFHGDPADRLIYATAVEEMVPLATADERIRAFAISASPAVRILW